MTRYDWLVVSFKLVGLVFFILGLAELWQNLVALILASTQIKPSTLLGWAAALQPFPFVVAGILLLLGTEACLSWCGERGPFRRVGD